METDQPRVHAVRAKEPERRQSVRVPVVRPSPIEPTVDPEVPLRLPEGLSRSLQRPSAPKGRCTATSRLFYPLRGAPAKQEVEGVGLERFPNLVRRPREETRLF